MPHLVLGAENIGVKANSKLLSQRSLHAGVMGQSMSGTGEQSEDYCYDPARERKVSTQLEVMRKEGREWLDSGH